MSFVIASSQPWHAGMAERLHARTSRQFYQISTPAELNRGWLEDIGAERIFFPHWSHILPTSIFDRFDCVIFHMTDLPYGRGGSPLQNLIVRGHTQTVLSAIKCVAGLDEGPIYLQQPLSLEGTAREIFLRASSIIEEMICEFVEKPPPAKPQTGEATYFLRRTPSDGNLNLAASIGQVYDFIRMLDAEGYPPAYLDFGDFRASFTEPSLDEKGVSANVLISRRPQDIRTSE
jgi:methionyl-tRNA formyltransferase